MSSDLSGSLGHALVILAGGPLPWHFRFALAQRLAWFHDKLPVSESISESRPHRQRMFVELDHGSDIFVMLVDNDLKENVLREEGHSHRI